MRLKVIGISTALLAGCNSQAAQNQPTANVPEPIAANDAAPAPESNASAPAERTPLSEPKGPIDPKSVEAAGQVVQSYGALIEQKRFAEAAKLWETNDANNSFLKAVRANRETHLEIGDLGQPEGAAGSIYVSMPVTLYGKEADGKAFRARRTFILRRVNDVPGSTVEQRRWHIYGFETGREGRR
jgi:hypothetical protein